MGPLPRRVHLGLLVCSVFVFARTHSPEAQVAAPLRTEPIPLVAGLTWTYAVETTKGDYESISRIVRANETALHVQHTATAVKYSGRRNVRRADLESSRFFLMRWNRKYPMEIPGSSSIGASTLVINDLKRTGKSEFACCLAARYDGGEHPAGTISLASKKPVPIPVIVNDQPALLPALHVTGMLADKLGERQVEFFFLDDAANPIGLRWKVGNPRGQKDEQGRTAQTGTVVKISFPNAASEKRIERALTESGRVDVYGIYFEFASATITPESEPVLQEIGDVMRRNRTWSLNVEGHTDNIGGDAPNLELSLRRANAVKEALVTRHRIPAARLETSGFGARRPKDTNTTVEGRARNRRVELVRQGPRGK